MSKRSDKFLHIMVTMFALVMTIVSAVVILYTRDPGWVHERVVSGHFRTLSSTSHIAVDGEADGNVLPTSNQRASTATPLVLRYAYNVSSNSITDVFGGGGPTVPANASVDLQVLPAGKATSISELKSIQSIIQKYHLVGRVTKTIQMGTNQTVKVYIAQNSQDYAHVLTTIGVSKQQAASLSADTGGFTLGNTILIAMYQNTTTSDIANTFAHELTHVLFNDNVGQLPSWINEGLAVSDGMAAQNVVQGNVVYGGYGREMAQSVLSAVANKQLIPLVTDETKVLQANQSYDIELQDWLSVQYLEQRYGYSAILSYFKRLKLGESYDTAFARTFHLTFKQFNQQFTQQLTTALHRPDEGVSIKLSVPNSFHGTLRILQHDAQSWQGIPLLGGNTTLTVSASGLVHGAPALSPIKDPYGLDSQTLYMDLYPSKPFVYKGQVVHDCGFALSYSDKLYGYADCWITTANGQTYYIHTPSLFGIRLTWAEEMDRKNPLIAWLTASSNS